MEAGEPSGWKIGEKLRMGVVIRLRTDLVGVREQNRLFLEGRGWVLRVPGEAVKNFGQKRVKFKKKKRE